jgi:hypothetical protein
MVGREDGLDPESLQPSVAGQKVVDGLHFECDVLEPMVATSLEVVGQAGDLDDADAVVGSVVGNPSGPQPRGRRGGG